ncbi:MAG: acyltransferase [Asgard group archaeon]|nr:acyltransferase [Asgard group archaeon]
MKIGFIQFSPIFGEKEKNISKSVELITKGADADLLVLPELCNTGYLFIDKSELKRLGEEVQNGLTIKAWRKIAEETDTYLVAGFCEKKNNAFYNSAVLIAPDGYMDTYQKIHLFNTEKNFFQAGNGPLKVYDIGKAKIGIIVCFDWIFPEITRILALNGAEIICHPANLVLPFAQKTMLARSIENRVFTITSNRIGQDNRPNNSLTFTGLSQITSPKMEQLLSASKDKEEIGIIEIDPSLAQNKMVTSNNHIFQDRRIDLYQSLVKTNLNQ